MLRLYFALYTAVWKYLLAIISDLLVCTRCTTGSSVFVPCWEPLAWCSCGACICGKLLWSLTLHLWLSKRLSVCVCVCCPRALLGKVGPCRSAWWTAGGLVVVGEHLVLCNSLGDHVVFGNRSIQTPGTGWGESNYLYMYNGKITIYTVAILHTQQNIC